MDSHLFKGLKKAILLSLICCLNVSSALAEEESFKISAPLIAQLLPDVEAMLVSTYHEIDITAEIIHLPTKRSFEAARKSQWVDAELARVIEAGDLLSDYIRVPVPLLSLNIECISFKALPKTTTWYSLKSYKVVTLRGFISITNRLKEHNIEYYETDSFEQAVAMLKAKRVDVLITAKQLLPQPLLTTIQDSSEYQSHVIDTVKLFHFIRNRHKAILPQLTQAMQKNFSIN